MVPAASLVAFALVALGMVLTPGPNMIYLITRSIMQGRLAGFISLLGVILGFVFYMLCAAFGLTALLLAVPFAYEAIQWAGAAYLLYLAWNAIKPGARSVLESRSDLPADRPGKLFAMGFVTNLLNPKIAVLYFSLLPQFVDPAKGQVLLQSILLGSTQIAVSFTVNLCIVFAAGSVAAWFRTHPQWLTAQRWVMASVLTGLAVRLALDRRIA
ncbi:LysE family translocator [Microvirga pakistanensis]|uniref:LysE family translocator n=1 Tax=Microvirga pakistanensis TaxID=1682650 RepID=UPI001068F3CF|nr:LysE family translocator [Microvirga pakistanensis]